MSIPDLRPVLFVLAVLLAFLGIGMFVPAIVDLAYGHPDWRVFGTAGAFTLFTGVGIGLASYARERNLRARQAFLLTALVWLLLPLFASLPFLLSARSFTMTDAYFEAMSGITTTGATVITGLDALPPGILLWRGLLQWIGGVGIIVMAIGVLPMLQVGGMQLFKLEGAESDKVLPRVAQVAAAITWLYIAMTVACALALGLAGMNALDAVVHAMTTIATGGFSTHDASIAYFGSASIEWIIILFMCIGSLPILLYWQVLQGRPKLLWRDDQVRGYFLLCGLFIGLLMLGLWGQSTEAPLDMLRMAAFNMVSVITGTGYASADYNGWGSFAVGLFFLAIFMGGCAGSTSCGIKVFHLHVALAAMRVWIHKLYGPHGVFVPRFNDRAIPDDAIASVMSFLILFVVSFFVLAFALSLTGLDFLTALSGAATAISNVGPGLGETIGPAGNFSTLPDSAKWLMSFGMLAGRLELFTVLVLLTPSFWRG